MSRLTKEKCSSCEKYINIGHVIAECAGCLNIIHSRCFPQSNFKIINKLNYCSTCSPSIPTRYNPFKDLEIDVDNDSDIFFNKNPLCYTGDTTEASNVLENCENFACKDVDMLLNKSENNFNTYFYNIDGNKSNFDVFAAEIKKIQGEISVIGIAETNVNSDQKDLYRLDNYESFYSDKLDDKKSGTGIALYVHEKFNATKNIVASTTVPHLESLFLTGHQIPLFLEFMTDLQDIMKSLPKTITYLMGDFNLDLHKIETSSNVEIFEQFLYQKVYIL